MIVYMVLYHDPKICFTKTQLMGRVPPRRRDDSILRDGDRAGPHLGKKANGDLVLFRDERRDRVR